MAKVRKGHIQIELPLGVREASGLTRIEEEVMAHLVYAWELYRQLEERKPGEHSEVADAMHAVQRLLALRVVARLFPDYWQGYGRG